MVPTSLLYEHSYIERISKATFSVVREIVFCLCVMLFEVVINLLLKWFCKCGTALNVFRVTSTIQAPNSADINMCVTCAEVLTGTEQKYVSSPNLKTGGFKLYKHKE